MLKIAGGCMIVTGCFGLGLWYRNQFILRLKVVRELLGILEMLMSEVRYGKTTLPQCCKRVGERQCEPYRSTFCQIYQTMEENTGECFEKVFREQMDACLRDLPVSREDRESFLSFAAGAGFEDGAMQLRTMERSRELLLLSAERMERENAEKCRMALGLGAMSGLLLIVLLL